MTITEALLTNTAYGYPTRGHLRRHTPHILAVVHQTAGPTPYDGEAMSLRNQRNGVGYSGNTATYYIDQDGDAVHAVDGTKYVSWCSAPENISYLDTTRASMATVKQHFGQGFNPNECVWEQFECVGTGVEPWSAAQFEFVAKIIAARAKLSGLPINRETVVPHRDMNTRNRPSDPWPAATREARMAKLIARAKALNTTVLSTTVKLPSSEADMAGLKFDITAGEIGTLTVQQDGTWGVLVDGSGHVSFNKGTTKRYVARVRLAANYGAAPDTQNGVLARDPTAVYFGRNVTTVPDVAAVPNPTSARDAANAALDKVASFTLGLKG